MIEFDKQLKYLTINENSRKPVPKRWQFGNQLVLAATCKSATLEILRDKKL